MVSYPNQSVVTIHKDKYHQDFLQVGKDEWMAAYADLKPSSFGLYLYLCGNRDKYIFALSSVAVQQALGISDSTYRRAKEELLEKGYFIAEDGNKHKLHFYPKPQPTTYEGKKKKSGAAAPVNTLPEEEEDWGEEALSFIASQREIGT